MYLCISRHHVMHAWRGMVIQLHAFSTSALDGGSLFCIKFYYFLML